MVALIYDSPALKAHFFRGGMKSRPTQVGTATLTNSHKTLQRIQVVAGLLPTAYKAKTQYLSAGGSMSISGVGGIMQIRNIYNSSGWDVWFCTEGKATRIATALYTTAVSVTMSGNTATVKNDNDGQRQIEVVYQTLL